MRSVVTLAMLVGLLCSGCSGLPEREFGKDITSGDVIRLVNAGIQGTTTFEFFQVSITLEAGYFYVGLEDGSFEIVYDPTDGYEHCYGLSIDALGKTFAWLGSESHPMCFEAFAVEPSDAPFTQIGDK